MKLKKKLKSIIRRSAFGEERVKLDRWVNIASYTVAITPSATFALIMKDEYLPAVFAMALVAIIVAADHDAALEEVPEEVREVVEKLDRTVEEQEKKLVHLAERILGYSERHQWSSCFLEQYEAQPQSRIRLTATIRFWEVHQEWALFQPVPGLEDEWRNVLSSGSNNVLRALTQYSDSLHVANERGRRHARFLTDAPVRVQFWTSSVGRDARFFYGLVYTMLMIYKALEKYNEQKKKEDRNYVDSKLLPARIRVGLAPIWAHVIGDETYQMIETSDEATALSRALHEDYDENRGGQLSQHRLATTYENVLVRNYDRGSRAESYIASILLSTQFDKSYFRYGEMEEAKKRLGGALKLDQGFQIKSWDKIEACCLLLGAGSHEFAQQLLRDALANTSSQVLNREDISDGKLDREGCLKKFQFILEEYIRTRARFLGCEIRENPQSNNPDEVELIDFLFQEAAI